MGKSKKQFEDMREQERNEAKIDHHESGEYQREFEEAQYREWEAQQHDPQAAYED